MDCSVEGSGRFGLHVATVEGDGMKVIVAQSTAAHNESAVGYPEALCSALESAEHEVQRLDLPRLGEPAGRLATIVSHRLTELDSWADALVSLDPLASVLQHRRKVVWLLDRTHLEGAGASSTAAERYLGNVLRTSINEADARFAPSAYARRELDAIGITAGDLLQLDEDRLGTPYKRQPGPEILLLSPLTSAYRLDLLVQCVRDLPQHLRARWIAPYADPGARDRLDALCRQTGVVNRVAVDIRAIHEGEQDYLLSIAAALLDLGRDHLVVPRAVQRALQANVPVIACGDGGALAEKKQKSPPLQVVDAGGAAIAQAVRTSLEWLAPADAARPKSVATGWGPLLAALNS